MSLQRYKKVPSEQQGSDDGPANGRRMSTETTSAPLVQQLTDEYGEVLPPAMISATVASARRPEAAREDLEALAEAVRRRDSAQPEDAR